MVLILLRGLKKQNNEGRSLFDKGSTNREKWGQMPNKKSFRTRDGLWQVWNIWLKSRQNCGLTERKSGSGRPRTRRTADNVSMIQDMICSQDDAPCSHKTLVKYKNILNSVTSLEYCLLSALQLLLWLLTDHNIN